MEPPRQRLRQQLHRGGHLVRRHTPNPTRVDRVGSEPRKETRDGWDQSHRGRQTVGWKVECGHVQHHERDQKRVQSSAVENWNCGE